MFKGKIKTEKKEGYYNLTPIIEKYIKDNNYTDGIVIVRTKQKNAGLGITSLHDPKGLEDLFDEMKKNVPARISYLSQGSPYDTASYVRSSLTGTKVHCMLKDGIMQLGGSQGIAILEFNGPHEFDYYVSVIPGKLDIISHTVQSEFFGMHDVTDLIKKDIEDNLRNGICHLAVPHSTAGIIITKMNPLDAMENVERIVMTRADFKHQETPADAAGHTKTVICNSQVNVKVEDHKLLIEDDERIYFAEFDGPRKRNINVGLLEVQ